MKCSNIYLLRKMTYKERKKDLIQVGQIESDLQQMVDKNPGISVTALRVNGQNTKY